MEVKVKGEKVGGTGMLLRCRMRGLWLPFVLRCSFLYSPRYASLHLTQFTAIWLTWPVSGLSAQAMAILTIRDILRGQTALDTIILRRQKTSAKPTPFKYIFIPNSYLQYPPPPSSATYAELNPTTNAVSTTSASASGVQPTMTPPLPIDTGDSDVPKTSESSPSPAPSPRGFLCHVLPHERLYDLGPKENWRRLMRMPLFDTWVAAKQYGDVEGYEWPKMNSGVLERMVRDLR